MKLIHMQTTITTVFGVDDGEGNAITQQPITVNVSVFKPEAFGSQDYIKTDITGALRLPIGCSTSVTATPLRYMAVTSRRA